MFTEPYVEDPDALPYLLEADHSEAWHVDCPSLLSLFAAPLDESGPDHIISGLRDDTAHGVRITSEIPLDRLVAESFDVEVAVATSGLLTFHRRIFEN